MCIDYWQLYARTRKNKYPLPQITNLLEQLSGARVFTKMDLRGAYHLLRVAAGHECKTTFNIDMALSNSRIPRHAIWFHKRSFYNSKHIDKFVKVYLDDILVYSRNFSSKTRFTSPRFNLKQANALSINLQSNIWVT